jgi:hypothetical protein
MPGAPTEISLGEARRIVLAAQGFARARPSRPTARHLVTDIDRLGLHQIDSVNVLARAHYLPAFSRLGAYDRDALDKLAWGRRSKRRLFEYWGHEASLLPLDLYPAMRWRMQLADRGEVGWGSLRAFARERRNEAMETLQRIASEGPLAASDFETRKGGAGWWSWSHAKQALEWLFWAGHLTTATRRRSFERVYDLPERVLPADIVEQPALDERTAHRLLLARAAGALGVATATDLRDYFRLKPEPARDAIQDLVDSRLLVPVRVEGWKQTAYLHAQAAHPRAVRAAALVSPFDPLVWERSRTQRLFDFRYRIEIYTPADKRIHGYYVLPFLLGDRLVGRTDLKADRQRSRLVVGRTSFEPGAPADARNLLAEELSLLGKWLGLQELHWE